jgi:hypothetical protein
MPSDNILRGTAQDAHVVNKPRDPEIEKESRNHDQHAPDRPQSRQPLRPRKGWFIHFVSGHPVPGLAQCLDR